MGELPIAINGFGRIGRLVFRAAVEQGGLEIKAINDLTDAKTLAHLLKYDSTHGRFAGEIEVVGDDLVVNGKAIRILAERDPANLPWGDLGVEVVLEATGFFTEASKARAHIDAGANNGRHFRSGQGRGHNRGNGRQRGSHPSGPRDHFQCFVYDQLFSPDGQSPPRKIRPRQRHDEYDSLVHRRPTPARRPAQRYAAGALGGGIDGAHNYGSRGRSR